MFSYKVYVSTPPTMYLTIGVHARGGMKSPRKADVFERCVNPRLHESFTTVWQMGSAKKARQGKSKFLPGFYVLHTIVSFMQSDGGVLTGNEHPEMADEPDLHEVPPAPTFVASL